MRLNRFFSSWALSLVSIASFLFIGIISEGEASQFPVIDVEGGPISLIPGMRGLLSNAHKYRSDMIVEEPLCKKQGNSINERIKVVRCRDLGVLRTSDALGDLAISHGLESDQRKAQEDLL